MLEFLYLCRQNGRTTLYGKRKVRRKHDTTHNDTRGEGEADGEDEAAAARGRYGLDEPQS